jgi:hypothetical protein
MAAWSADVLVSCSPIAMAAASPMKFTRNLMARHRPETGRPVVETSAALIDVLVGIWLVVSAFAWPHPAALRTDTWVVGALVVLCSLLAGPLPLLRYLNAALAVWLVASTLALGHDHLGTVSNNLIAAVLVFSVSVARSSTLPRPGHST